MKSIEDEANKAFEKYSYFHSTHELYGVLQEEVDEFFEEVRQNVNHFSDEIKGHKRDRMIHELTQIAAIAYRGIRELEKDQIKFV